MCCIHAGAYFYLSNSNLYLNSNFVRIRNRREEELEKEPKTKLNPQPGPTTQPASTSPLAAHSSLPLGPAPQPSTFPPHHALSLQRLLGPLTQHMAQTPPLRQAQLSRPKRCQPRTPLRSGPTRTAAQPRPPRALAPLIDRATLSAPSPSSASPASGHNLRSVIPGEASLWGTPSQDHRAAL